jgi:hypothetical protein
MNIINNNNIIILGIKIIYYVYNIEFKKKYLIYCLYNNKQRILITINDNQINVENIDFFNEYTLIPTIKIEFPIKYFINNHKSFEFKFELFKDKFKKTKRHKDKRLVWFYVGPSNSKEYILENTDMSCFDLVKHNFLPDLIECDIIITEEEIKSNFSYDEIKKRCIGDNEYIIVYFNKINDNIKKYWYKRYNYVYIFNGDKYTGKRYIANKIKNMSIYETDSNYILPNNLKENVIIIGNKYKFTINDIMSKYKGNNIFINVEFSYLQ